ncbi:hypothetical protein [Pseudomonas monsensis]|uniref:hypothetical protein n=1 Tax=Pseudomonas monsensis TaxID=2745509 RepID=UPI003D2308B4
MQVYLSCPDCVDEQARHEASSEPSDFTNTQKRLTAYPVQLTNEISYEVKCVFGHSSAVLINMTNHEILFEFGVHSILDGYYREAVTSSVHKGKIPTHDEAVAFGEEVLSIISGISLRLWQTIPEAAHKVLSDNTQLSINKIVSAGGTQPKHVQSLDLATHGRRSLKEHLKRKMLRHSKNTLDKHNKIIDALENK